jgi:hypothetical protein
MMGFKEQLGNLSWLGDPQLEDKGWFETDIEYIVKGPGVEDTIEAPIEEPVEEVIQVNIEETIIATARKLLSESDWAMMPDIPITNGTRTKWQDYRKILREIKLQPGFPDKLVWPQKP